MNIDTKQETTPRPDESRRPDRGADGQSAAPAPATPSARHFVDPYDMHGETTPEEPGYGHGV